MAKYTAQRGVIGGKTTKMKKKGPTKIMSGRGAKGGR